jgi:hypothetical protein
MQIETMELYSLYELPNGLAITARGALRNFDAIPLVEATPDDLAEYLARYLRERQLGKTMRQAHTIALQGAKVLRKGDLDG